MPPPAPAQPGDPSAPDTQGPLVLVVDDEPLIRDMLTRVLEALDYRVITVGSALHAIEAIWELPEIACVISDQRMAGPGGVALLDYVARERPACGRVIYTGHAGDITTRHQHAIVEKGTPMHELAAAVRDEINLRSRVSAAPRTP